LAPVLADDVYRAVLVVPLRRDHALVFFELNPALLFVCRWSGRRAFVPAKSFRWPRQVKPMFLLKGSLVQPTRSVQRGASAQALAAPC
jgi:hypothetical protein